ncbi:hypothetical protein [Anaeromicrobium sediminis]|uniref:hypothetical protein n=1 Tax=Anaeromicrobium sediminis TaxID=1478221 RepID=UPI001594FC28|nr:hypothetical protein [Anaeromicrobium sediminis]
MKLLFLLSDIVGTRNFLKNEEEILIILELTPIWHIFYREVEEHIKKFKMVK